MLFFLFCSVGSLCFGTENGSERVEQPREFFAELCTNSSLASFVEPEIHFRNPPCICPSPSRKEPKEEPKDPEEKKREELK